jgi:hypothetical protein
LLTWYYNQLPYQHIWLLTYLSALAGSSGPTVVAPPSFSSYPPSTNRVHALPTQFHSLVGYVHVPTYTCQGSPAVEVEPTDILISTPATNSTLGPDQPHLHHLASSRDTYEAIRRLVLVPETVDSVRRPLEVFLRPEEAPDRNPCRFCDSKPYYCASSSRIS